MYTCSWGFDSVVQHMCGWGFGLVVHRMCSCGFGLVIRWVDSCDFGLVVHRMCSYDFGLVVIEAPCLLCIGGSGNGLILKNHFTGFFSYHQYRGHRIRWGNDWHYGGVNHPKLRDTMHPAIKPLSIYLTILRIAGSSLTTGGVYFWCGPLASPSLQISSVDSDHHNKKWGLGGPNHWIKVQIIPRLLKIHLSLLVKSSWILGGWRVNNWLRLTDTMTIAM